MFPDECFDTIENKKTVLNERFFLSILCVYFLGTVSVAGEMVSAGGATVSAAGGTLSVTTAAVSTSVPLVSSVLFGLHETIPIPAAKIRVRAIFFIK